MASLSTAANSTRSIQFVDRDGRRRRIRLGKMAKRKAEAIKLNVEHLAIAAATGTAMPRETSLWLEDVGDVLHGKLATARLVTQRESALLGLFLAGYLARKAGTVKPGTLDQQRQSQQTLIEFFGASKPLRDFNQADAVNFRNWLISEKGLAEATVRKRCGNARMFFKHAQQAELVQSNPFESVATAAIATKRHAYISRDDAALVMDALSDAQWRLLFALARYGGLRVPSEPQALTWADVDWQRQRLTIHSQKTEHIAGHETRQIPIFPEIAEPLQQVFDEAAEGEQYVLPMLIEGKTGSFLRNPFMAAIKRAGVKQWPRLWHNLRSTRQTELEEDYPSHVVCSWIGNSEKVAAKHYLQLTDEHFEKAAHNAAQQVSASGGTEKKQPKLNRTEAHVAVDEGIKTVLLGMESRQQLRNLGDVDGCAASQRWAE